MRTARSSSWARPLGRDRSVMATQGNPGSARLPFTLRPSRAAMTGRIAMIRSMTAFAACERAATAGQLSCELRSVNHRFLELSLRLPEELRPFESAMRERVAAKISRGKVDLSLRLRVGVGVRPQLQVNNELLEQLALLARRHHAQFPNMTMDFIELMRYPGVVEDAGVDQLGLQAEALALLDQTLVEFVASREREGANLAAAMHERLDGI